MIKQLQFSLCAWGFSGGGLFLLGWFGVFLGGGWLLLFVCFVVVVCGFSKKDTYQVQDTISWRATKAHPQTVFTYLTIYCIVVRR